MNTYEVTYMEMAVYTVTVEAESEQEARSIVRSGEGPVGYCTESWVDEVGHIRLLEKEYA